MKYYITIITLLFVSFLLLCGCNNSTSTSTSDVEELLTENSSLNPDDAPQTLNDSNEDVEELLTQNNSFNPDDAPQTLNDFYEKVFDELDEDKIEINLYDTNGELRETFTDSYDLYVELDANRYGDGPHYSYYYYDIDQYDKNNRLIIRDRFVLYDQDGYGDYQYTWAYDRDDKLKYVYKWEGNDALLYGVLQEGDRVNRSYIFSLNYGTLSRVKEYDPSIDDAWMQYPFKISFYDDGQLSYYMIYQYDDNLYPVDVFSYFQDGTLDVHYKNVFDENGNYSEQYIYDENETLLTHYVADYDSNGDYVASTEYDGDGRVVEEIPSNGGSIPLWSNTVDYALRDVDSFVRDNDRPKVAIVG